jgi:peroxiredoxin
LDKINSSRLLWIILGVAVVLCILAIAALGLVYFALNLPASSPSVRNGGFAPDFNLPSLSGQNLSLSDLRGKPVLINFWATWCYPCLAEMPLLEESYQKHSADNLVVIGINEGDRLADVETFVQKENLSFPILLDYDFEIGDHYQLSGYPTSIFVDKDGIIRAIYLGEIPPSQLEKNLRLIGIE